MSGLPQRLPARLWRIPLLVFLLALTVTGALAAWLISAIGTRDRLAFENEANRVIEGVQSRVHTVTSLLRGAAGLFDASTFVGPIEFQRYVDALRLPEEYPGVLGIGFAERVPAAQLDDRLVRLRAWHGPDFHVFPDTPRDPYYIIEYLQPMNRRNEAALGYDMFTEPVRRAAMEKARDEASVTASGKVLLVQEVTSHKQAGFLLYKPLYRSRTTPETVAERRRDLVGFAYSPLRAGDLLRDVRDRETSGVALQVWDGTEPATDTLLYASGDVPAAPGFVLDRRIDVAGRQWLLRVSAPPGLIGMPGLGLQALIATLALASSALFGWISLLQVRARFAAEQSGDALRAGSEALHRERERLRAMLGSIGDAVVAVDRQARVVLLNRVAETLTGWRAADAVGRPLAEVLVPVPGSPAPDSGIDTPQAQPVTGETVLQGRDGGPVDIEHTGAAILDPNGRPVGAVLVFRDVGERRRQQRALSASEEHARERSARLAQLAAATPLLHATLSEPMLVERIEHEACALFGAESARLEFHRPTDDVELGDLDDPVAAPTVAGASPRPAGDGAIAVDLLSHRGQPLGRLTLQAGRGRVFDDDDRALLRQLAGIAAIALRNVWLVEELRRTDRRKDEFLATLAHELRNPLAPIAHSLELLRRLPPGDQAEHAREVAERQTRHMVRLIDDLLDLSRISRGRISLQRRPMPLAPALEAAIETVQPLFAARQHRFTCELDRDACVDGDPARLAQVFANLLGNAANYTEPGGEIALSMRRCDEQVEVSIRDNGIGIAADALPRVFEMFVRGQQAGSVAGGLGIGLTLVRRLVAMHGGSVQAHSGGPGRGSEFVVRLPLVACSADELQPVDPDALAARSADRVLVVDDNIDAAESLALLLSLDGYRVETAHDGPQALAAAERTPPSLVLLDIGLPGLDGYQVAERLRARHGEALRLVALTGWGQATDRKRAREAGFDLHLVKPVDYPRLSAEVRQLLAG